MKLFREGLTAMTLVAALAAPALARVELDVCVDAATGFLLDDADGSGTPTAGDGEVATGTIYAGGTIPDGGVASCGDITAPVIGKFFSQGRLLADLTIVGPDEDIAYVDWQFRVDGVGSIDTSGPIRSSAVYPQTITGATRRYRTLRAGIGEAQTKVLGAGGFQFRLIVPAP